MGIIKEMHKSRPEDALVKLVKLVKLLRLRRLWRKDAACQENIPLGLYSTKLY